MQHDDGSSSSPTVADYIERTSGRFGDKTRSTYAPYWRLLIALHGDKRLEQLTTDDLIDAVKEAGRRAKMRRPSSTGRAPEEAATAAIRAIYARAEASRLIGYNPATNLKKPTRNPNRRRPLTQVELEQVWEVTRRLSSDADLDLLIVRFHVETGARQQGALTLRRKDLDFERQTIWLHEKFGKEREQPVSSSLLRNLADHGAKRGATGLDDLVFRYRPDRRSAVGQPLTRRRYDRLFSSLRNELPWAARMGLSAHVLRYTAGTSVERIAGFAVARAFLGHQASAGPTSIYTQASIHEVAAAVALLTGEPHPLALSSQNHVATLTSLTLPLADGMCYSWFNE